MLKNITNTEEMVMGQEKSPHESDQTRQDAHGEDSADKKSTFRVGRDSVVLGQTSPDMWVGDRNTIVGATDTRGNTIIDTPMAAGYGAQAGPSGVSIGTLAGAGATAAPWPPQHFDDADPGASMSLEEAKIHMGLSDSQEAIPEEHKALPSEAARSSIKTGKDAVVLARLPSNSEVGDRSVVVEDLSSLKPGTAAGYKAETEGAISVGAYASSVGAAEHVNPVAPVQEPGQSDSRAKWHQTWWGRLILSVIGGLLLAGLSKCFFA